MAQKGATAVRDGVQVIQGTPTAPLTRATLFLRLLRVGEGKNARTRATLFMVRPGPTDYVVKELIPDLDLDPHSILHVGENPTSLVVRDLPGAAAVRPEGFEKST